MAEIIVLLGAGASAAAGVPLMNDFLESARKLYDDADPLISREQFRLAFDIIDDKLQQLRIKSVVELGNIESVYSLVEMGRLLERLPRTEPSEVAAAARAIKQVLVETVERYCLFDIGADGSWRAPDAYRSVVEHIADDTGRVKEPGKYAFITFNYDVALDFALYRRRVPIDYSLDAAQTKPAPVPVLKLHGSLYWNGCSECRTIRPIRFDKILELQTQTTVVPEMRPLVALRALSGIAEPCIHGQRFESAIVPPTWNKTEYHSAFGRVWRRAAQEISEARQIFLIGYSAPESDAFFKDLLALSLVGPTPLRRFAVVNPDPNVGVRIKKWLGPATQGRFESIPARFDGFLRDPTWTKL
jgi:hypothetical protein